MPPTPPPATPPAKAKLQPPRTKLTTDFTPNAATNNLVRGPTPTYASHCAPRWRARGAWAAPRGTDTASSPIEREGSKRVCSKKWRGGREEEKQKGWNFLELQPPGSVHVRGTGGVESPRRPGPTCHMKGARCVTHGDMEFRICMGSRFSAPALTMGMVTIPELRNLNTKYGVFYFSRTNSYFFPQKNSYFF